MLADISLGGLTLSEWASVATILGAIFVVISAGSIWYQIRLNTELLRFANTQALVGLSSPLNLALIQDRQVAEYWVRGATDYDTLDDVDKDRFRSLLFWWLNLHENIYYQHKRRLLDAASYRPWEYDLRQFVLMHDLGRFWPDLQSYLQTDFAAHVQRLIDESTRTAATKSK